MGCATPRGFALGTDSLSTAYHNLGNDEVPCGHYGLVAIRNNPAGL